MATLQEITLAAENSAKAKHSAICLRNLQKLVKGFIDENPKDPIIASMIRYAVLEGIYRVLYSSSGNQHSSITDVLTNKFGISDVRGYDKPGSKTKALINQLIDSLLISDHRFDSLESELRKLEPELRTARRYKM